MADSSHTITDYGQTLRGRNMLVLVDGVPLNTNRDSSRNLANINPADIEQIEVLRGSSAIYGSGAAGGIISVRTKRPSGETKAETIVTGSAPLSKLRGAGLGAEVQHYLSGGGDVVDYSVSLGAKHVGGSFDAKGRRIAPEPSQGDLFDSDIYNASAKIGFKLDANQRLQFSASHYNASQDTDYASDPSVARLPQVRLQPGLSRAWYLQIKTRSRTPCWVLTMRTAISQAAPWRLNSITGIFIRALRPSMHAPFLCEAPTSISRCRTPMCSVVA
jgi:iron complex outermembrane receptor protein